MSTRTNVACISVYPDIQELEHWYGKTHGGAGQYNQVPSYEATVVSIVFIDSILKKVRFAQLYFVLNGFRGFKIKSKYIK